MQGGLALKRLGARGHVEVWVAQLDATPALGGLLTEDESARAARLRDPAVRRRWTASRALLRVLLGERTGRAAETLRFTYGRWGRPRLDAPEAPRFSLSRAGGVALYAISDRDVGVDVAAAADVRDPAALAAMLAPGEAEDLACVPPRRRGEALLACWTQKEAYCKARGSGLSLEPSAFRVAIEPPASLLDAGPGARSDDWWLASLPSPPGYVAALSGAR